MFPVLTGDLKYAHWPSVGMCSGSFPHCYFESTTENARRVQPRFTRRCPPLSSFCSKLIRQYQLHLGFVALTVRPSSLIGLLPSSCILKWVRSSLEPVFHPYRPARCGDECQHHVIISRSISIRTEYGVLAITLIQSPRNTSTHVQG